jgi:4-aminobutyrate aminotransferase-like enzyme
VIKIRPPLVFSEAHADRVTAALDATLSTEMG